MEGIPMKPTLLSLLAALLLVSFAHAEETVVIAPVNQQVELKIRLYEIANEAAVAAGLDTSDVLNDEESYSARFSVIPVEKSSALLDRLSVERKAQLMLETDIAAISGWPAAVTQMQPMPQGVAESTNLSKLDAETAEFAGRMGYHIGCVPTVDEKGYITLAMHAVASAPGITRELPIDGNPSVPVEFQATRTTLRVASGTTICAANLIPMDTRMALAKALQAASEGGAPYTFPATTPTPGTTLYLIVTPSVIVDR
jgi:Flp pilus assembly secretin CpaC